MKTKRITGIAALACLLAAVTVFGWSLTDRSQKCFVSSAVQKCEKALRAKQLSAKTIGEELAIRQRHPLVDESVSAFYFTNGKLHTWTATDIPVSENELAAIDTTEQFIKLGYSWYVTKAYLNDSIKIVTAVRVKEGYSYENDFLQPEISNFLRFTDLVDILPPVENSPNTVYSENAVPLFSLVINTDNINAHALLLRWIAIALFIISIFVSVIRIAKWWGNMAAILLLICLRCALFYFGNFFEPKGVLFSTSLYADSLAIPSLGSLLLHTLFAFLAVILLFRQYKLSINHINNNTKTTYVIGLIISTLFAILAHYILRSLILNSVIPLNLPQLDRLTAYTFVAYGILLLLYTILFIFLYMALLPMAKRYRKITLLGYGFIYIFTIALYTLVMLEVYGHRKETAQAKVMADKLAIEHDPTAELHLNSIGQTIATDVLLKELVMQHAVPTDEILQYITRRYLQGYMQQYDLQLTICPQGTGLQIGNSSEIIDCDDFFGQEIADYGTRLNEQSIFYYLNNDNGRNSYLGLIRYTADSKTETVVYLELDSRLHSGGEGYPDLLIKKNSAHHTKIHYGYSYAKYTDKRLVTSNGEFRYPNRYNHFFPDTHKAVVNGYAHLLFSPDGYHTIVISRSAHDIWSLILLFSHLLLIYTAGLFILLHIAGTPLKWRIAGNTFQRKVTILLIASFIVSILFTAVFTVSYNISRYRKTAQKQMEEKMHTVIVRLNAYLMNAANLSTTNEEVLNQELINLSNSMHIDINLYDITGRLATTSREEIFNNQLQSTRMNRTAFNRLERGRIVDYLHKEQLGNLTFYSAYAIYYNINGQATGFVNIPYFSRRMSDIKDVSAVVTSIINMYILVLIVSLFTGTVLVHRLLRPLEIVRRHMQRLDVKKKMDYIQYEEKDELGDLIRAYNQMLKALEESTRQLAQNERENAWREMARQIAHEIKNPLTPMRLSIQHLMRLKKENTPDWPIRFDELSITLLEQIDTLAKTASEFATFAKSANKEIEEVSLTKLLDELRPLFNTTGHITYEWRLPSSTAPVAGRSDQLSRVLVNLLTNATQAVQGKSAATIKVSLTAQHNEYSITIEDSGNGVPVDLQEKLFTPNFTTKSSGSGLGLAISKKIIEEIGGRIIYSPSTLGGACFTVYLQMKYEVRGMRYEQLTPRCK